MRVGVGAREHDEVVAVEAAGLGDAVAHRGALPPPVLPRAVQKAAARRVQPMIVADYVAGAETGSVVGELEHSGPPGAVEGQCFEAAVVGDGVAPHHLPAAAFGVPRARGEPIAAFDALEVGPLAVFSEEAVHGVAGGGELAGAERIAKE